MRGLYNYTMIAFFRDSIMGSALLKLTSNYPSLRLWRRSHRHVSQLAVVYTSRTLNKETLLHADVTRSSYSRNIFHFNFTIFNFWIMHMWTPCPMSNFSDTIHPPLIVVKIVPIYTKHRSFLLMDGVKKTTAFENLVHINTSITW